MSDRIDTDIHAWEFIEWHKAWIYFSRLVFVAALFLPGMQFLWVYWVLLKELVLLDQKLIFYSRHKKKRIDIDINIYKHLI